MEKYIINEDGSIFNTEKRKYLQLNSVNGRGYKVARLNGKSYSIHRLVAEKFIPNPNNYKYVNHINGIKIDNRVENLEWCTPKQNSVHASTNGWMQRVTKDIVYKIRKDFSFGLSKIKIAKKYDLHRHTVRRIINKEDQYRYIYND